MSEKWYSLGKCAGCGELIVRRHDFRGAVGQTLTRVCCCSPKLEVRSKMVKDEGAMIVWQE